MPTRRRNASDVARDLPNVVHGGLTVGPGEEFDAPDTYPWGDPIAWDEDLWPAVKTTAAASKPARPADPKE